MTTRTYSAFPKYYWPERSLVENYWPGEVVVTDIDTNRRRISADNRGIVSALDRSVLSGARAAISARGRQSVQSKER